MLIRRDEHDIDKAFRQKLHDAQEAPPAHLWEGIRKQSGGRRRFAAIWFWLVLAVVSAAGVGGYHLLASEKQIAQTETLEPIKKENNEQSVKYRIDKKEALRAQEEGGQNQEEIAAALADASDVKQLASAVSTANKNTKSNKSSKRINGANAKTTTEMNAVLAESAKEQSHSNAPMLGITDDNERKNVESTALSEANNSMLEFDTSAVSGNKQDTEQVVNETLDIEADSSAAVVIEGDLYVIPNAPKHRPISLGLYASIFQPNRKFQTTSDNNNGGNTTITNAPQTNTTFQKPSLKTGYAFGIGAVYQVKPFFYLMSGIELAHFKEEVSWKESQIATVVNYTYYSDTSYQYIDEDSILVVTQIPEVIDSSQTVQSNRVTHINTYTSLQLPIAAGLSWQRNNWLIGLEGGVVFKLRKTYNGFFRTYDAVSYAFEDSGVPLSQSNPQVVSGSQISTKEYYTDWKMDCHLAMRFAYSFSQHWQASVALQYRWMSEPAYGDPMAKHRLAMPGTSLGLFYKF